MYFSTNIKLLRKRKGRTQDDMAFALGMKRSTLSGYENEISQPTILVLIAFSRYFGIAVDTLLKVDLRNLTESQLSQLERGGDVYLKGSGIRILATTVNSDNDDNIELVSEKAKAGYATGFSDPEFIRDLPVFQLPFLSKQKKYRTFQLNGDSMLPIPSGSYVTGEFVQNWNTIISGHGYIVFTLDEGIVFKIVENLLKTEHKLRLYSLNPIFEPFDIHASEVKEIWKFVNYISSEIPDPMIPQDELIKTVTGLKQDINLLKSRFAKEKGRNKHTES